MQKQQSEQRPMLRASHGQHAVAVHHRDRAQHGEPQRASHARSISQCSRGCVAIVCRLVNGRPEDQDEFNREGRNVLRQIRRALASLAVIAAVTAGVSVAISTPAAAACNDTNYMLHQFSSHGSPGKSVDITNCGSNLVAVVDVVKTGSRTYKIFVDDRLCDNIGPYWHAHAVGGGTYSYGDSNGCKAGWSTSEIGISSVTAPLNWWVQWHGWNTPAFSFPS